MGIHVLDLQWVVNLLPVHSVVQLLRLECGVESVVTRILLLVLSYYLQLMLNKAILLGFLL